MLDNTETAKPLGVGESVYVHIYGVQLTLQGYEHSTNDMDDGGTWNLNNRAAQVVGKVDSAIHRINHYLADSVICFVHTYPLDSDLSFR